MAVNKQLRKQLAEFRVPQVMLYVQEKIRNGDLEKTIRMWERKVEIAEVSHREFPTRCLLPPLVFLFFELRIQAFGHAMSMRKLSCCFNSYTKIKDGSPFPLLKAPFSGWSTESFQVIRKKL